MTTNQSPIGVADEDPVCVDQSFMTAVRSSIGGADENLGKNCLKQQIDLILSLRTTIEVLVTKLQLYRSLDKVCK